MSFGNRPCKRMTMNNQRDDNQIDGVLRYGLQAQPVPQLGPDFDEIVLAALRSRRPWWQSLWFSARPIVSAAACSMIVMLAVSHWALQPPARVSVSSPAPVTAPMPSQAGVTTVMLDKALDQPNLQFGTFARLLEQYRPNANISPPLRSPRSAPSRPPEPRRRDGLAPHREALLA